jgi:NAD(P)H dehydrogenase (quinone)
MIQTSRRVLVMGTHGRVRDEAMKLLAMDKRMELVGAVKSAEEFSSMTSVLRLLDPGRDESMLEAFEAVDTVLLVASFGFDLAAHADRLVTFAEQTGVRHLVYLSNCGEYSDGEDYLERFRDARRSALQLGVTELRPDCYMQNLLSFGGLTLVSRGVINNFLGNARLGWIDSDDVAQALVTCLMEPEAHRGKVYHLAAENRTYDEIRSIVSSVVGQPFHIRKQEPKKFFSESRTMAAKQDVLPLFQQLQRACEREAPAEPLLPARTLEGLIGRRGKTWAQFVAEHIHDFMY